MSSSIYTPETIAVLGSHSALDVCYGAKKHGFKTIVIAEKGRELTYSRYYATAQETGCVDECIVVDRFAEVLSGSVQKQLLARKAVFVPHRSFEVYTGFDYEAIEDRFPVPMFGNRFLLKIEERGVRPNQYDLLERAQIHYPQQFPDPRDIDRLCIVKVLEQERGFERAFFLVSSYEEYKEEIDRRLTTGVFTEELLNQAVIEEFVVGVHVNFNFFYSTISGRLELLGTDTRRQTNLEGIMRTPVDYQEDLLKKISVQYEEAGHIAVTVLESMLEPAFAMGERFVQAALEMVKPGVIGPFALQSIITAGPPKKEIVVVDVSPRMPGSPGTAATPYSSYLFRRPVSVGERVAMEIRAGLTSDTLKKVIT
ncbi:MAG: DUF1297 domain-containing protein [Patescibacteria group bacterium]